MEDSAQPHETSMADIGGRLREERIRQAISQRVLAERLGLSPSLISQIERGRSKPSVSTLYAIVTELGISLDRLFGGAEDHVGHSLSPGKLSEEASSGQTVVHPDQRLVIELESGVRWERLTTDHNDKVDFLYVVYEIAGASSTDGTLMRHQGREYGYLISGRLGVQVRFQEHLLEPGDSIAFDSTQPHRLWNPGNRPAHALWYVVGRDR